MNAIVCVDANGGIGFDKDLLFHSSKDMKRFRALTTGAAIIMGRKTFETFPGPLKDRLNIVLSKDPEYKADGVTSISYENLITSDFSQPVWVVGGAEIYNLLKDHITHWEITYFPESVEHNVQIKELIDDVRQNWTKVSSETVTDLDKKSQTEKTFYFETYTR